MADGEVAAAQEKMEDLAGTARTPREQGMDNLINHLPLSHLGQARISLPSVFAVDDGDLLLDLGKKKKKKKKEVAAEPAVSATQFYVESAMSVHIVYCTEPSGQQLIVHGVACCNSCRRRRTPQHQHQQKRERERSCLWICWERRRRKRRRCGVALIFVVARSLSGLHCNSGSRAPGYAVGRHQSNSNLGGGLLAVQARAVIIYC